jgi:release factor glutamine methyltransferase
MMTFQQWLTQAIVRLSQSESPRRDAEILLGHVTGRARTYILAFGETALTAAQAAELEALLSRRARGEPVAIWWASASSGRCRCSFLPRR